MSRTFRDPGEREKAKRRVKLRMYSPKLAWLRDKHFLNETEARKQLNRDSIRRKMR